MLVLLTFSYVLLYANAATLAKDFMLPDHPLLCVQRDVLSAALWTLPMHTDCATPTDIKDKPLQVDITVYRSNALRYETKAIQCIITRNIATSTVTFLGGRNKVSETVNLAVSRQECDQMITKKKCSHGQLKKKGEGWYSTSHEAQYKWQWLKTLTVQVTNCAIIEGVAWKKHGAQFFETPLADVRHCRYSTGSCPLNDGSYLRWGINMTEQCQFLKSTSVKGEWLHRYFVSEFHDMALTFTSTATTEFTACDGSTLLKSDQGVFVNLPDNLTISILNDSTIVTEQPTTGGASTYYDMESVLSAHMQALDIDVAVLLQKVFWRAYSAACSMSRQNHMLLRTIAYENPVFLMRHLLNNSNTMSYTGSGFIETYPCKQLTETEYKFKPVPNEEGLCSTLIPVEISVGHLDGITLYLDSNTLALHPTSAMVPCQHEPFRWITLKQKLHEYHPTDGTVRPSDQMVEPLQPFQLQPNAPALQVHDIIFGRTILLSSWDTFQDPKNLNHILGTAATQNHVLDTLGIVRDSKGSGFTFRKVRLFAGFRLLTGEISAVQIYTVTMSTVVLMVILYYILRCCIRNCIAHRKKKFIRVMAHKRDNIPPGFHAVPSDCIFEEELA